jgi:hypothetical protein
VIPKAAIRRLNEPSDPSPRAGLAAALVAVAALLAPATAVAPPPGNDTPPGAHRSDWPMCAAGFFNSETIGRTHRGVAGGMRIRVVWQNQNYLGLPVTLDTDGHESSHVLAPRQTTTQHGVAHFVFGDMRPYPEFGWRVSARSPASAVLLSYRVYVPRCQGSDSQSPSRASAAPSMRGPLTDVTPEQGADSSARSTGTTSRLSGAVNALSLRHGG